MRYVKYVYKLSFKISILHINSKETYVFNKKKVGNAVMSVLNLNSMI